MSEFIPRAVKRTVEDLHREYVELYKSGMFWEVFPELTGKWEEDRTEFIRRRQNSENEDTPSIKMHPQPGDPFYCETNPANPCAEIRIRKSEPNELPISEEEQSAVEYIETNYPEMAREFRKIQAEQYETFCKKQRTYGPSNISVGTNLETDEEVHASHTGLWFRVNDKIQRLKQMILFSQPDEVGEGINETFDDMSIYGIIAQIVTNGKWAK